MNKVAIIGNAGGGKTLLAQQLGKVLKLPVFSIDNVSWYPGWRRIPDPAIAAVHGEWLKEPRWIIDGWGSWEMIEQRFEEADTIILVHFPVRVHYRWALQRQILATLWLSVGGSPPPAYLKPPIRKMLRVIRRINRKLMPPLVSLVSEPRFRERLVLLRSPRELRRFRRRIMDLQGA